jgi:hypothetical protein
MEMSPIGDTGRFALADLEAATGLRGPRLGARLSDVLGIDRTMVCHARHRGLNALQADVWAVACGLHPAIVWPGWLGTPLPVRGRRGTGGTGSVRPWGQGWRVQVYVQGGRYLKTTQSTREAAEEARLRLLERAQGLRAVPRVQSVEEVAADRAAAAAIDAVLGFRSHS